MSKILGAHRYSTLTSFTTTKITSSAFTNGTTVQVAGTYVPPSNVLWLRIRMAGGGGGGAGSGNAAGNGTIGVASIFGTSLLNAGPGSPGVGNSVTGQGAGGTASVSAPAVDIASQPGGNGGGQSGNAAGSNIANNGGYGGTNPYGGAGHSGGSSSGAATTGGAGVANTGAGGGGGGSSSNGATVVYSGSGGGAGAYIDVIIPAGSILSSYTFSVGTGGNGGAAGGGGGGTAQVGGAGGSGVIEIEEHYV